MSNVEYSVQVCAVPNAYILVMCSIVRGMYCTYVYVRTYVYVYVCAYQGCSCMHLTLL